MKIKLSIARIGQKSLIIAVLALSFIFSSCRKDQDLITTPSITTQKVAIAPNNNDEKIFEDGEELSVYTSESRRIDFSRLISVNAIDNTTIEITNFVPLDVSNVTILLKIKGSDAPIKLMVVDIKAHTTKRLTYSFVNEATDFLEYGTDKVISLAQYKAVGIAPSQVSFDYTGSTPLLQKLKKAGEMKWQFKPNDFDINNNHESWKDTPTPQDFRKFSALLINMAYLYSSATNMRQTFLNEPITNNDVVVMTTAEKLTAYNNIVNKTSLNIGICEGGVTGLGGGSTLGIAASVIEKSILEPVSTFAHEMGHVVGFSHASSMTYPQNEKGSVSACQREWLIRINDGSLPVQLDNYYIAGDFAKAKTLSFGASKTVQVNENCIIKP